VDSDSNLLVVTATDEWLHPRLGSSGMRQRVAIVREYDEVLGLPETGTEDGAVWIRYPFPDGFEYVLALAVHGIEHTDPVLFTNEAWVEVKLDYGDQQPKTWTVFATATTSLDSGEPLTQALANLREARAQGEDAVRDGQRRWWQGFWSRSGIELEDRFMESLWYLSLYQLASTSRGKTAPGLCGLWNMMKSPPWHGDYHGDINMVMTYWGIFAANHLEIGEPYFETFSRLLPVFQEQTRELYQIDGVKYPIATLDTGAELTGDYYRIMQCTSGFYALVFWWRWLYERDEEVLRRQVFPVLEESSKFYLGIAEEREGVLHFGPSWAPEQGPFPCWNSTNDIALIKALWQAYVVACDVLGVETEWLPKVREGLSRFPPYPTREGRFRDSYTAEDHIRLNHPGLLAMVVPGHEVDADHPLRETAVRTMEAMFDLTTRKGFEGRQAFCCDLTWPGLVAAATKLGEAELADDYLFRLGVSEHLKPNGMFTLNCCGTFETIEQKRAAFDFTDPVRHGAIFWCPTTREGRERYFQFIQAPGGVLYGLTEMLLQSHGGVIRVFPAVPARIRNCAFRGLRAEGAFEVSARRTEGRAEYVVVRSERGGECAVRLPDDRTWQVTRTDRPGQPLARASGDLRFSTEPPGEYTLTPERSPVSADTSLRPGVEVAVKVWRDPYGQEITLGKRRSP